MGLFTRVLSSVVSLCLLAGVAGAEPLSYQGSLQDNGQPANGVYDLEFRLYDSGANPVTAPVELDEVEVVEGLFSVEINFPDGVFDAFDDLELGIRVRDGGSVGGYTELLPRTSITPAPVAVRAFSADNAEFTRDGNDLFLGDTNEQILINPDLSGGVSLSSSTDLQLNFQRVGFGGMYINGNSTSSLPRYGFSMGGNIAGYIYMYDPLGTPGMGFRVGTQNLFDLNADQALIVPDVEMSNGLHVEGEMTKDYNGIVNPAAPSAYGYVNFDAAFDSGSDNFSVAWDAALERYVIDFDGFNYHLASYTAVVSVVGNDPIIATTSSGSGNLYVYLHTLSGLETQKSFHFIVYKND